MNKGIVILIAILLSATIAYCVYFGWATKHHPEDSFQWLQTEYSLSDKSLVKVREASASYLPQCRAMCQRLAEARQHLADRAASLSSTADEIADAYAKVNEVEEECIQMSLHHVYQVATLMPAEQSERYRKEILAALLKDRTGKHKKHSDMVGGEQ
ncbi:MAG: hypothetical protein ACI9R3_005791 [Verrucomicrobiales bacterium]|jgi:hypothetical protein